VLTTCDRSSLYVMLCYGPTRAPCSPCQYPSLYDTPGSDLLSIASSPEMMYVALWIGYNYLITYSLTFTLRLLLDFSRAYPVGAKK